MIEFTTKEAFIKWLNANRDVVITGITVHGVRLRVSFERSQ